MKNLSNNTVTIEISHNQDFINGTTHNAYLVNDAEDLQHRQVVVLTVGVPDSELFEMMECLQGIKARLEQLGKHVKVVDKFFNDPNFETQAEADKFMQEM